MREQSPGISSEATGGLIDEYLETHFAHDPEFLEVLRRRIASPDRSIPAEEIFGPSDEFSVTFSDQREESN